jgi:membrane-associated protease RseP (regulator of RpoE activity)
MDLVGGLNLFVVILGFGFLILVHELGHYLAAR